MTTLPKKNFSVNTQHCPVGAFASFTLGAKGALGGLGLELGRPAEQNVYVGLESEAGGAFDLLPFCDLPKGKVPSGVDEFGRPHRRALREYRLLPDRKISRTLTPSTDVWESDEIRLAVHSPVMEVPDPSSGDVESLKLALVPAVTAELTVDNSTGQRARRFFFGFAEGRGAGAIRRFQLGKGRHGQVRAVAYGRKLAIATDAKEVFAGQGHSVDEVMSFGDLSVLEYGLGSVGLLAGVLAPGEKRTIRLAICFYRGGPATTGVDTRYLYTKWFENIEAVADYAIRNFRAVHARGSAFDQEVQRAGLSPERVFMLSQVIHSYYGSTQLLAGEDGPWWIVNEGEYRMMNTLDLTVDQIPFEMRLHPWTLVNALDRSAERYSYKDKVRLPGSTKEYPGGISFTHDIGRACHFSPPGNSAYELSGANGIFSWMTHEELLNWPICGLVAGKHPRFQKWAKARKPIFEAVLKSLMQRDHPNPKLRDGVMDADSSRSHPAHGEITSYDSLDPALCQSRRSLYLAVKSWGVYVGLADYFECHGDKNLAQISLHQADLAATTIANSARADGTLPALLGSDGETLVLPAVEGLITPYLLGLAEAMRPDGRWGNLLRALKLHFEQALASGRCHFPDGGWKISSTAENSWLSKIYLNGFLADRVLGAITPAERRRSDRAHAFWSLDEQNAYWAWSDQILNGKAIGSKYYPRGVTAALWLDQAT